MNENQINGNAVSVYGQEGLEDFPVLKAFQQYIDAEQNKARKRMVMLCAFFGLLMTAMIIVFLFILKDVSSSNKSQNDRLLELVLKSSERQNVIVQQPTSAPSNDAALKALTDTLVAMHKQASEQQEKAVAAQLAAAQAAAAQSAATPPQPTQEQSARQRQIDSEAQKLAKANEQLKAEKAKLAAEKEKLRQQEIEFHRRRMYPDYYEKLDREAAEADAEETAPAPRAKPKARKPQPAARPQHTAKPQPTPRKTATGALSYFDAYEEDEDTKSGDDDIDTLLSDLPPIKPEASKPASKKPAASTPATPAKAPTASEKPADKSAQVQAEAPKADATGAKDPAREKSALEKLENEEQKTATKPQQESPATRTIEHFNVPLEINGAVSDWLIPAQ